MKALSAIRMGNEMTRVAATLLTAAVPLLVYFISGRWFVRGIAAGAVKG